MNPSTLTESLTLEVGLFGDRHSATITKNRCNWKVVWRGLPIDSFVPIDCAINPREAAIKAAGRLESLKWGNRVLMASLRGAVNEESMSTEHALWINAKYEGKPFDRHAKTNPAEVVALARAALARAKGDAT